MKKRKKTISELNPGDLAWVVIPGVIDHTFKTVILYPSIVKVEVSGRNSSVKNGKSEISVSVYHPKTIKGLSYRFPTVYETVIESASSSESQEKERIYSPEERALAESYYDNNYDDVYMGEDYSYQMLFTCFANKKLAAKKFLDQCDKILEETSASYQAQKKKLIDIRKQYDAVKKLKEKTMYNMNKEIIEDRKP